MPEPNSLLITVHRVADCQSGVILIMGSKHVSLSRRGRPGSGHWTVRSLPAVLLQMGKASCHFEVPLLLEGGKRWS